jgi:EpsI family protein
MDEKIVRATDTDAIDNRHYARSGGLESVGLYIAAGVQARDLMPHRPEVCYTGNGWTLVGKQVFDLPLTEGEELPCNVMRFRRSGVTSHRIVVLDYYLVDGEYCADVSLLRSKVWRGSGTVDYVAQVQIVTPVSALMTPASAVELLSTFAVDSALPIARVFEQAVEDRDSQRDSQEEDAEQLLESNTEGRRS